MTKDEKLLWVAEAWLAAGLGTISFGDWEERGETKVISLMVPIGESGVAIPMEFTEKGCEVISGGAKGLLNMVMLYIDSECAMAWGPTHPSLTREQYAAMKAAWYDGRKALMGHKKAA